MVPGKVEAKLSALSSRLIKTGPQCAVLIACCLASTLFASQDSRIELVPQFGQSFYTSAVAISPDGELAVTGGDDGIVSVWDFKNQAFLRHLQGHGSNISSVAISHDGKRALTGSIDQTARLWDLVSGRQLVVFAGHKGWVNSVAFSSNDRWVLTGSKDNSAILWDSASGKKIRRFIGHPKGAVNSVAFSPDGSRLLTGSEDGSVRLWDIKGRELWRFGCKHRTKVHWVSFSPDGEFIVFAGICALQVHNVLTGDLVREFGRHGVVSGQLSPDGKRVLISTLHKEIQLVNLQTGEIETTLGKYDVITQGVAFSRDGNDCLAGVGNDVYVYDCHSGNRRGRLANRSSPVSSLAVSEEGKRFVSVPLRGRGAFIGDLEKGREGQYVFGAQNNELGSIALSRDGRLALAAVNSAAIMWDINTGHIICRFEHTDTVNAVGFSSTELSVITASKDKTARIWDVSSCSESRRFTTDSEQERISLSKTGRLLAASGEKGTRVWDTGTRKVLYRQKGGSSVLIFSPDGTLLLHDDGKDLELSEALNGRMVRRFVQNGKSSIALSGAISSDGKKIVAGFSDGRVLLWDVATARILKTLKGHSGMVLTVAFSLNNDLVYTGGWDGTVRIWSTTNGNLRATVVCQTDASWSIVDVEGRFDINDLEGTTAPHWVASDDPLRALPPEIFMRDYYEPRLLPRLLAGEGFRSVRSLVTLNRVQPAVHVAANWADEEAGLAEVKVKVGRRNDPAMRNGKTSTEPYDLRVFRDRQLVGWAPKTGVEWQLEPPPTGPKAEELDLQRWQEKTEIKDLDPDGTKEFTFPVQVSRRADLKEVTFTAYAFNEDRVKSTTASVTLKIEKSLKPRRGKAYVISVGVNRTDSSPAWDLQYAANDARQMSQVVGDKLEGTEQFARVVRVRLVSAEKKEPKEAAATKVHVQAVLDMLAGRRTVDEQLKKEIPGIDEVEKAQPEDLVLLAFSGHGYTDDRGVFHMVLADIGANTPQNKITPELQRKSLSSDELSGWLRDVDAGEMVMVVDSCHSAATVEAEGFKPGPMGSRGLGQMAYDKGMRILAASKSEQSAVERDGIKHGLLSYALVDEGLMQGLADFQPKDGKILISEWLAYGEQEVPKLFREGDSKGMIQRKGGPGTTKDAYHGAKQTPERYQEPVLFDFSKNQSLIVLWEGR